MARLTDSQRLSSYSWFYDVLKSGDRLTQSQLLDKWQNCYFSQGIPRMSPDTFRRHLDGMADFFKVTVKCDKQYRYYIERRKDFNPYIEYAGYWLRFGQIIGLKGDLGKHFVFDPIRYIEPWLSCLAEGFESNRIVKFVYQPFEKDSYTVLLKPKAFRLHLNRLYVLGNNDHGVDRTYSFDRMGDIEVTNTHFDPDLNFDAAEHYKYAFGSVADGYPLVDLKIKVDKKVYDFLRTNPLGPEMMMSKTKDNCYLVKTKLYNNYELGNNLMRMIDHIEILEPRDLRETLMRRCQVGMRNQSSGMSDYEE